MSDVYLKPGETWFGAGPGEVKTLLGSCVAVTLWNPRRRLGGMCHFVLPSRAMVTEPLDGRYGDEAMEILLRAIHRAGTQPREYRAGIFGGGNMFPNFNTLNGARVGDQNIARARALVRKHGFVVESEDVGGFSYRHVTLDLEDGRLWLKCTDVKERQGGQV